MTNEINALELVNSDAVENELETQVKGLETLANMFRLVKKVNALDIIKDIIYSEEYEEKENQKLTSILSSQPAEFYYTLSNAIITDDYIIPDWGSVTDYHEYTDWTIELAEELTNK